MSGLTNDITTQKPVRKSVEVFAAATTVTVWSAAASTRIVLTGLDIANAGASTNTLLIYFTEGTTGGVDRIGMYSLGTTSMVSFRYPGLETNYDNLVRAVAVSASRISVNAYGFELK